MSDNSLLSKNPINTYDELVKRSEYEQCAHRPCFDNFDDYVAAYPEAEHFRRWVTDDGVRGLVIMPCFQNWCGLPGDYYFAYIWQKWVPGSDGKPIQSGSYYVHVNDCDDSGGNKYAGRLADAKQELENLKLLAPFTIRELAAFGYEVY